MLVRTPWRALDAALALGLAAMVEASAGAALRPSARLQVSAQVLPSVRLHAPAHPASLTITAEDVRRGYVDVTAGIPYDVRANVEFQLEVRRRAEWIRSAVIRGFAEDLHVGRDGGTFRHDAGSRAGLLRYRLETLPCTLPGVHAWPLALAVVVAR